MLAMKHVTSWSKDILVFLFYSITDYLYSRLHHRERFLHPVSAYSTALSHTLILLTLIICSYFWNKKVKLPQVNMKVLLMSVGLSSIFRFNILDFNHNFGAPSYKYITVILLPLVLYIQGADMFGCIGTFVVILISSSSKTTPVPIDQVLLGMGLSFVTFIGLYYLMEKKDIKADEIGNLHKGSKITIFVDIASEIFLCIILCDISVAIFDGMQERNHNELGIDGILLFTLSTFGKFLIIFSNSFFTVHVLLLNWVVKTIMFSSTYTLAYKFDLTVHNLVAIIIWLFFVISYTVVYKLKKIALIEVQYDSINPNHTD